MIDKEIQRNAEGYYDPTAYKALKKYIEGEKIMRKGDIWEIKLTNGEFRDAIIIAINKKTSVVLHLNDNCYEGSIEVNCQGIRYTDPCKLQYAFNDQFTSFIRSLKDEEMDEIMEAISNILGINQNDEIVVKDDISEPQAPIVPTVNESADLVKLATERDIYKDLYERLLADVLKGGQHV